MIKLIVFLGNPGRKYKKTRHNIAWLLEEKLSFTQTVSWQKKWKGVFSQTKILDETRYFLKPETYMNRSGESVEAFMQFFKIIPSEILIIHDDIEIEFGQIGFKYGGGLGGHNGLRSIVSVLGTRDFYRFRLGVSKPNTSDIAAYVLSGFSKEERADLPDYLEKAAEELETYIWDNLESGVDQLSKKKVI
ncbi:aminoacyl-tRNA hydrolase [bacterium]